jgi:NAD(P)H-dependent FMN reductase
MADLKVLGICGSLRKASFQHGGAARVQRARSRRHEALDRDPQRLYEKHGGERTNLAYGYINKG